MIFAAVQSLKTTLESIDAVAVFNDELKDVSDKMIVPVSDGGDGFLNVMKSIKKNGKSQFIKISNSFQKKHEAEIYITDTEVFVESADIVGMKYLKKKTSVLKRDTGDIGRICRKYYSESKKIILGIGGTSTADSGGKMLEEMGFDVKYFSDTAVLKEVERKEFYKNIYGIADVSVSLNGADGASLFTKQKGASNAEKIFLRKAFDSVSVKYRCSGKKYLGCGGGLGFAVEFAGGRIVDNFSYFDKMLKIKKRISSSDVFITCEGKFDEQSMLGKITGKMIEHALKESKQVFVITGETDFNISGVNLIVMKGSVEKIRKNPEKYLKEAIKKFKETVK